MKAKSLVNNSLSTFQCFVYHKLSSYIYFWDCFWAFYNQRIDLRCFQSNSFLFSWPITSLVSGSPHFAGHILRQVSVYTYHIMELLRVYIAMKLLTASSSQCSDWILTRTCTLSTNIPLPKSFYCLSNLDFQLEVESRCPFLQIFI